MAGGLYDAMSRDEQIAERFRAVVGLYETRAAAAAAGGISTAQLYRYLARASHLPFEVAAAICLEKGVSLDWLTTGRRSPGAGDSAEDRFDRVRDGHERRVIDRMLRRAEIGRELGALLDDGGARGEAEEGPRQ